MVDTRKHSRDDVGKGEGKLKFYEIMMWKLCVCVHKLYSGASVKGLPKLRKPLDKEFQFQQILLNVLLPFKKENFYILLSNLTLSIPVLSIFTVFALIVLIAHTRLGVKYIL